MIKIKNNVNLLGKIKNSVKVKVKIRVKLKGKV